MNDFLPNKLLQAKLNRLDNLQKPAEKLNYQGVNPNNFADLPSVAIVGSRRPTIYGRTQTEKIANLLAKNGILIISGLALGVDGIAHQTTLQANGLCLAVLPSGLDKIYPATNQKLAQKIIDSKQGTLISEYPAGHRPRKVDFLNRNRIIAALSDVLIITEAAERSGTLNTARQAQALGVPVFAVPGNNSAPNSQGCNRLIKEGLATLLQSGQDILDFLNIKDQSSLESNTNSELSNLQADLLKFIQNGINLTDQLILKTKLNLDQLNSELTVLEIEGYIQQNSLGEWIVP